MSSAPHDVRLPLAAPRVALIVTSLSGGDAEAVGADRLRWFVDAGYDVSVITVSADHSAETADVPESVRVYGLGGVRGRRAQVRSIRQLIVEHRFDVLIALQTSPNVLAVAASRGLAPAPLVVLTELGLLTSGLARPGRASRLRMRHARLAYRHADLVASSSHAVAAELSAAFGVPASRSLVVPDPALPATATRVARTPGTADGVQIVLLSPLTALTRPHLAILAARELNARGIRTEVLAFGDGPLVRGLSSLAKRSGVSLTIRVRTSDWGSGLGSNPVVFLPTREAGLGAVLVEAAAHGVPSVAMSTALGVADAVIPGITGELAFDDDAASIADALEAAAQLDVGGVDDWLERFSSAASGALLERAIDYAAARRVTA